MVVSFYYFWFCCVVIYESKKDCFAITFGGALSSCDVDPSAGSKSKTYECDTTWSMAGGRTIYYFKEQ